MKCRILLADDHRILRESLRDMIAKEPDWEVVAEASTGRVAVTLAHTMGVDVVVMDIAMPDLNGIEATRQILSRNPRAKVMILSMHSDRRFISEVFKAGAVGYLLKDCAVEELMAGLRCVCAGETYISPRVAGLFVKDYLERAVASKDTAFSILTPREREVLQMLAEGKNTKEIAVALHLSVKTVETHRQQTMTKLNIHSVAELTKYALREGLTSLDAGTV
jgi:DNA-binding NarL/FixJ family response regulator